MPSRRYPDAEEHPARVSSYATARVKNCAYSVPAQLINAHLLARVSETTVSFHHAGVEVARYPRALTQQARIDYRHVSASLVRKLGAFARYLYREELFPRPVFRQAYDQLFAAAPAQADRHYIELLALAARTNATLVATVLGALLRAGEIPRADVVEKQLHTAPPTAYALAAFMPELHSYDSLVQEVPHERRRVADPPAQPRADDHGPRTRRRVRARRSRALGLSTAAAPRRRDRGQRTAAPSRRTPPQRLAPARGQNPLELRPSPPPRQSPPPIPALLTGEFVRRGDNLICFGLPGRGKTLFLAALCRELVQQDQLPVFYTTAHRLVTELLVAKRELKLDRLIAKCDRFAALAIDELGYTQQSREEMEVLFTLLAKRYEKKSVLLYSNLVPSQWDQIVKDSIMTMAAVDGLVHHAVILEFNGRSYRAEAAEAAKTKPTG